MSDKKTLEQIRDRAAEISVNRDFLDLQEADRSVRQYKIGFDHSTAIHQERIKKLVEKLKAKIDFHEQAYSLDIFPDSETINERSTIDSISARMGRHMIKCFREYIHETLQEWGEK